MITQIKERATNLSAFISGSLLAENTWNTFIFYLLTYLKHNLNIVSHHKQKKKKNWLVTQFVKTNKSVLIVIQLQWKSKEHRVAT